MEIENSPNVMISNPQDCPALLNAVSGLKGNMAAPLLRSGHTGVDRYEPNA